MCYPNLSLNGIVLATITSYGGNPLVKEKQYYSSVVALTLHSQLLVCL